MKKKIYIIAQNSTRMQKYIYTRFSLNSLLFFFILLAIASCNGECGRTQKDMITQQDEPKDETPNTIDTSAYYKNYFSIKLGVPTSDIENIPLYAFVLRWEGTPHSLDGDDRRGISRMAFLRRLYKHVYDISIPSTKDSLYYSELQQRFTGQKYLAEGDLVFFGSEGRSSPQISDIGVYLQNDHIVIVTFSNGVDIRDLKTDNYYNEENFLRGGRFKSIDEKFNKKDTKK